MAEVPVALNASERLLKEESLMAYPYPSPLGAGYTPLYGDLWLTNQRLMCQVPYTPFSKKTVEFPLSHITAVAVSEKTIRLPNSLVTNPKRLDLFVIEFDNGGREYFHTGDLGAWVSALQDARAGAPEVSYTTIPSLKPGVEATNREAASWFGKSALFGIGGILLIVCVAAAGMIGCFVAMSLVFTSNAK